MTTDEKFKLIGTGILEVVTFIFTIFLDIYSNHLKKIQEKYDNQVVAAFKVMKEPDYFTYFVGGIILVLLLVVVSIYFFRTMVELSDMAKLVAIVVIIVNIMLLVALITIFWNPVFTAFCTVIAVGGIGYAALSA